MLDHIKEWWPAYLIGLVAVGFAWLFIVAAAADEAKWAKFSAARHCKVVGRMSGSAMVSPVISEKGGVAITLTPDKTGWLCDDGVTYWRDN